MPFSSPDGAVLRAWGQPCEFICTETDESYTVKLMRDDDAPDGELLAATLLVLFGTPQESGFVDLEAPLPVKNDSIVWDGVEYRVYDVHRDNAGGTSNTGGLWLYLDAKA
jgi:hypothetical protein